MEPRSNPQPSPPKNVKLILNPPTASHFGGAWERQIRTIRKVLLAYSKEQRLTDEALHTLMCEVKYIVNSRPLTKSSDDQNDFEALTPNHLLLLKTNRTLPPGLFQNQIFIRENAGVKCNTSLIYSGLGGLESIYPHCKSERNGTQNHVTFPWEMLF